MNEWVGLLAGALREAFGEKSSEARLLCSAGGWHPDQTTVTGSWQTVKGSDGGPEEELEGWGSQRSQGIARLLVRWITRAEWRGETHGGCGRVSFEAPRMLSFGGNVPSGATPLACVQVPWALPCVGNEWTLRFRFEERVPPGPASVSEEDHRLNPPTPPSAGLCPMPLSQEVTGLGRIRGPQCHRAIQSSSIILISLGSVQFSCSLMSNSLQPHGLQHARLPWSLLKLMSIESVMPSNHLILVFLQSI